MQKKFAKSLAVGALSLTVGLSSFATIASAKAPQATSKAKGVSTATTKTNVASTKVATTKATTTSAVTTKSSTTKTKAQKAPKAHKRTIPGKVASIDSTTLKMTKGNKTYTVSLSSASFLDRTRKAISSSNIAVGDKVSVTGLVSGLIVTAQTVRDISLPKSTTTKND